MKTYIELDFEPSLREFLSAPDLFSLEQRNKKIAKIITETEFKYVLEFYESGEAKWH